MKILATPFLIGSTIIILSVILAIIEISNQQIQIIFAPNYVISYIFSLLIVGSALIFIASKAIKLDLLLSYAMVLCGVGLYHFGAGIEQAIAGGSFVARFMAAALFLGVGIVGYKLYGKPKEEK